MSAEDAEPAVSALADEIRLSDPDAAYSLIAQAHRGLDEAQSAALNARLVLVLANRVGDLETLRAAVALAMAAGEP